MTSDIPDFSNHPVAKYTSWVRDEDSDTTSTDIPLMGLPAASTTLKKGRPETMADANSMLVMAITLGSRIADHWST